MKLKGEINLFTVLLFVFQLGAGWSKLGSIEDRLDRLEGFPKKTAEENKPKRQPKQYVKVADRIEKFRLAWPFLKWLN